MPRKTFARLIAATVVVVWTWPAWASESDLSATVGDAPHVSAGELATFTIRYGNAGPDEAQKPFIDLRSNGVYTWANPFTGPQTHFFIRIQFHVLHYTLK